MPEIRPRIAYASRTIAILIKWPFIRLIAGIFDIDAAAPGEEIAVAGIARRHHAIEHIDALSDGLDDIFRSADAHQITRFIARQLRRNMIDHGIHDLFVFTYREATDRIAVKADLHQLVQTLFSKVEKHAPLID